MFAVQWPYFKVKCWFISGKLLPSYFFNAALDFNLDCIIFKHPEHHYSLSSSCTISILFGGSPTSLQSENTVWQCWRPCLIEINFLQYQPRLQLKQVYDSTKFEDVAPMCWMGLTKDKKWNNALITDRSWFHWPFDCTPHGIHHKTAIRLSQVFVS